MESRKQYVLIQIKCKSIYRTKWFDRKFSAIENNGFTVDLKIDKSRLPYMAQTLVAAIESVMFVAKVKDSFSITAPITSLSKIVEIRDIDFHP